MVSVRVNRFKKSAARGSCWTGLTGWENLCEMCESMWYLGSFGEEEKMRLTTGAASARSGWWRQRRVSRACLCWELTVRLPSPLVDTGTDNHDIVNDCETAFACNPLAIFA
jgi:hypothetical protein